MTRVRYDHDAHLKAMERYNKLSEVLAKLSDMTRENTRQYNLVYMRAKMRIRRSRTVHGMLSSVHNDPDVIYARAIWQERKTMIEQRKREVRRKFYFARAELNKLHAASLAQAARVR